jgi:hypothetical protein
MCILFQIATLPAWAQCPVTTYSVGSGVGVPNLSGAPGGVASLTSGQSITITGTFTIDVGSWVIAGANVYLATTASEIIINSGTSLNASVGATFQSCGAYKWYGIRVQTGGTIIADHCTFTDGQFAVNAFANTTFTLTNNTFNTCTRGMKIWGQQNPLNHTISGNVFNSNSNSAIYITGKNVTVGNNTYRKTGAPLGAAITLDNSQNILIDGGTMINLARGLDVLPVPNSSCIEMRNVIFSGERGVTSDRARYSMNIHNCLIRATKTAIDIKNHLTATLPPPGVLCSGNINVANNTINSFTETGVRIASTLGNGTVTVYHNFVGTEVASTGFGQYGIEIFGTQTATIIVDDNDIVNSKEVIAGTPPGAIYLNNCKHQNTVSRNTVIASPSNGFGDMVFGITAVGTPHLNVSDNSIDGGNNVMDRAISIENAMLDVDLCCWFSIPSNTELTCNSACGNGFSEGSGNELTENDYWAMTTLSDASYSTLHWGAQRNLFAKLLAFPALLENTQASTFFNSAQNGNIGKFHTVEVGIANLYDPALTADPAQKLTDLATLNSSIATQADYQSHEKYINQIYLTALGQNNWDFSASEKVAIDNIAAQCPQLAGKAVYTARFLQENYRVPAWNTDCAFVGARSFEPIYQQGNFEIFPNPAQDLAYITLSEPITLGCKVELLTISGQLLRSQEIVVGNSLLSLPISDLPNGCYFVRISGGNHTSSIKKLSIIH